MDRNVLMWYALVERMEEKRMVKRVYSSKVEGSRARGRAKLRWMDSVKDSVDGNEYRRCEKVCARS
jgi:hypothetical protein